MHRSVWAILVVVACTPLMLVVLLFGAAYVSPLDRVTLAMPTGLRTAVAALALSRAGYGKESLSRIDRVLRLDPDNADAWSRRCELATKDDLTGKLARCREAVGRTMSASELSRQGEAQEKLHNYCAAEDAYLMADTKARRLSATIARSVGRAALECGRLQDSVASLKVAESTDVGLGSDNVISDRELLVIAYKASGDASAAAAACTRAHPDWKGCDCSVNGGEVRCSDAR